MTSIFIGWFFAVDSVSASFTLGKNSATELSDNVFFSRKGGGGFQFSRDVRNIFRVYIPLYHEKNPYAL